MDGEPTHTAAGSHCASTVAAMPAAADGIVAVVVVVGGGGRVGPC